MRINLLSERYKNDGAPAFGLSDVQREHVRRYVEKCESGEYSFRKRECECGNGDLEVIAQKDRYGLPVETVICRNCGLIMTDPCLDDTSNNSFYDGEYHYIYRAETTPTEEHFEERKNEAVRIIEFIRKHTGMDSGSVLEIGCADGGNVAAFAEKGYEATGIDLSHTYVEFGKERGLDLYCSDASSFAQNGQKFDIVVLNHVLEHFTDLERELNTIADLMNDTGVLFVAVPGVKYLTFGAYKHDFLLMLQNAHIFNFTKDTLCQTMKKYGFDSIFANEAVYALFKKGDPESSFSDHYSDITYYLKCVEDAGGDTGKLLIQRVNSKLTGCKKGDVLLYGTVLELDALVRDLSDLSAIRGFFYTDKKTPEDAVEYMKRNGIHEMVLVDAKMDQQLIQIVTGLIKDSDINLMSVYRELF
ncbi:MAG: class I SAM-dependent methyltransferase [Lachnospiraceae bacterium]|nr:class I SAM-dependent methyltransferase [Lachnospiraceae bacterium]